MENMDMVFNANPDVADSFQMLLGSTDEWWNITDTMPADEILQLDRKAQPIEALTMTGRSNWILYS